MNKKKKIPANFKRGLIICNFLQYIVKLNSLKGNNYGRKFNRKET